MTAADATITGGCLCRALRYAARGSPDIAGFCCCADCRRTSGSGYIGFMGFAADALTITGATVTHASPAARGGEAVRSRCAACGSLVFGGIAGVDVSYTIYAGSLDDPAAFVPAIAIFTRDKPAWVVLPPGLTLFATMPG